uniref:Uncharacterized protein n=1 Tax=Romanomermis culicivorax TaxID=13658 RepID=A0A915IYS6_ROMCU
RSLTFVDLDVGQNSITIPGAIAAVYIEKPGDPIDGLDNKVPLVYHYGHKSPGQNIQLYNTVVDRLAYMVNEKCKRNKTANVGGVIINTCGWIKGEGYECIRNAAEAFEVDVVVVLDHERLYNELQKDLPSCVKTVHQPKSGGVEERTQEMRVKIRRRKIRQYFYGTVKTPLTPHSFPLRFDEVEIYKIGVPRVPDSCMPLGMKSEDSSLKIVQISPQTEMIVQRILAVSHCENLQDEDLVRTNVAGFVCVTEVNLEQKTFTVLSPQPYPLPRRILLLSDVDFVDH